MPIVIVSDDAFRVVQAKALIKFDRATSCQRPNGDWEVTLDDALVAKIKPYMHPHESISEAIERSYGIGLRRPA